VLPWKILRTQHARTDEPLHRFDTEIHPLRGPVDGPATNALPAGTPVAAGTDPRRKHRVLVRAAPHVVL
jgi:hypothetical protein